VDVVGRDGTGEGLRCAHGSVSAFALVGEGDLEQLPVTVFLLIGHASVLAEKLDIFLGWPQALPPRAHPSRLPSVTPNTLANPRTRSADGRWPSFISSSQM
jgi:hypothetical protein